MGVDVRDVGGREPRLTQGDLHRPGRAETGRVGLGDVVGVGGDPGAGDLGVHLRAAGRACSSDSSTSTAAPSPRTKPSRPLSQGREARCGSSLRLDSACIWPKAAIGSGWMAASVPPDDHDVGAAEPDQVDAERDRLVARRAGGDRRVDAGLGADRQADARGGAVGHQHRDRQRRDPARALLASASRSSTAASGTRRCRRPSRPRLARGPPSSEARPASAQASSAATIASCPERSRRRALRGRGRRRGRRPPRPRSGCRAPRPSRA